MSFEKLKTIPLFDLNKLLFEQNRTVGPLVYLESVTNDVEFKCPSRAIYVGDGGDISIKLVDGSDVYLKAVPTGAILPVCCIAINDTSTTATSLVWGC